MNHSPETSHASSPSFEHWCFISYRHLDNKGEHRTWASWLHQEIEHYEVPAELVGTLNDSGEPIPAKIYPVFRDEDSLAADSHLGEEILEALRGSRTMLVICSPRSAISRYVDSEITFFQSLGRGERIITAIIDGEPNDSNRECFPAPLRLVSKGGETINVNDGPLAADFRLADGTEGFTSLEGFRLTLINSGASRKQVKLVAEKYEERMQLMKLKIVSGILNVGLEKLRNRDKAYRLTLAKRKAATLRRWLAAVATLAVISVAGGGIAYLQRREAKRQEKIAIANRNEAEKEATNARHQVYRTQIRLSASLIQKRELAGARNVLLKTEPTARGWEWAYLLSRCGATPTDLAVLQPDSKWITAAEIQNLKSALEQSTVDNGSEAMRPKLEKEIRNGRRQVLSDSRGRGGAYSIVYQSSPPTPLFSYWLGMYTEPAKNAFSADGTVLTWSGDYGDPGGRRANVSTGDMLMDSSCIAPLPNRLTLEIKHKSDDGNSSSEDPLLDPLLLPFGPMSFGPSGESVPMCDVRFEAGKALTFSFESRKGPTRLTRDLAQTPIQYSDKLVFVDSPEQSLIAMLAGRKIDRKFCCWFDLDGERRAVLEGDGLELWKADASGKIPICMPGLLSAGLKDAMGPTCWGHTAVQIGKTRRIGGWLQTDKGRFLGIGNIDKGTVDMFLLDKDGSRIPEGEEFAYNVQTLMTASPSGSRIYYSLKGRNDDTFQTWDGKTGKLLSESESETPMGIGSDPEGSFVAVVDARGEFTLRKDFQGEILHRYPGIHLETTFDLPVRRSPDGTRIMISNLVLDATNFEDLLLLEPGTRISDDWNTAVSWVDGRTAEISSMAFWGVLKGDGDGTDLFLNEKLLLNEIMRLDQNKNKPSGN